jgi:hypothetical protein
MWGKLPVRYLFDWMALKLLLAMALAVGRPGKRWSTPAACSFTPRCCSRS